MISEEVDFLFMKRFINRERELAALEGQYATDGASFMVIYGRRRVGKTTLIREFIKSKPAFYFLAREENETVSMKRFAEELSYFTGQEYLRNASFERWQDLFDIFLKYDHKQKKLLIID